MTGADRRRLVRRARVLTALALVGLGGLGARAAALQIGRYDELSRLSREEYLSDLRIPARRGHIVERTGKPLAITVAVPSVFANPSQVEDPRQAARQLAAALQLDLDTVYQRLASDRLFVWLKRQVTPEVAEQVEALGLAGVGITKESRRFYPNREVGAHLIGFCGVDAHGLEGVERQLDDLLAGEPQVVEALRDGRGKALLQTDVEAELRSAGAEVALTIDLRLQHALQAALQQGVRSTQAKAAMAVALAVDSAEVLAMAAEPTFNPNQAAEFGPAARRNRAVTDMFEPGSTLKPLVVAAALEAGAVEPGARIFTENGQLTVVDHTIRDGKPHGWLTLTEIIAKSSNVGAAKVGLALGRDQLSQRLAALGLGRKTGIAFPGETAGLLAPAASWSKLTTATVSFGHGVAVSALQLAAAYRAVAAGGVYRAPTLVGQIETAEGRDLPRPTPEERRVFSAATARRVTAMMEQVVTSEGTGLLAAVAGYRVAGKTGTAQKVDAVTGGYSADRFLALFAGFLPAETPRVVIVVVLDEPQTVHTGGGAAAPIFAEIGAAAMRYLGVVPSEVALKPAPRAGGVEERAVAALTPAPRIPAPVAVVEGDDRVPSFIGLSAREVLSRYVELGAGVDLRLEGSGRVVRQSPAPGEPRPAELRVQLVLARD